MKTVNILCSLGVKAERKTEENDSIPAKRFKKKTLWCCWENDCTTNKMVDEKMENKKKKWKMFVCNKSEFGIYFSLPEK